MVMANQWLAWWVVVVVVVEVVEVVRSGGPGFQLRRTVDG